MRIWQTLVNEPYGASNGLSVSFVGNTDALFAMGHDLRNGLTVHYEVWGNLCLRGRRQIFCVQDAEGKTVANGEMKVNNGSLVTIFVRGFNNIEQRPGHPTFMAVQEFLSAINEKRIPLALSLSGNRFSMPSNNDENTLQHLWKLVKSKSWSPFAAMILGPEVLALDWEPTIDHGADVLPETSGWAVLSPPYRDAVTGLVIEPAGSLAALKTIGEEMENMLFMFHDRYAVVSEEGVSQFVAIMSETGGMVACAELRARCGEIVVATVRGEFDSDPTDDALAAVTRYVEALNEHRIVPGIPVGESGFDMDGTGFVDGYLRGSMMETHRPTLLPSIRALDAKGGLPSIDTQEFFEDGFDEDGEWVGLPGEAPATWPAFTPAFQTPDGFCVEPIGSLTELDSLFVALRLDTDYRTEGIARKCAEGLSQVARISDTHGVTVAFAEAVVIDGEVVRNLTFGRDGYAASPNADGALAVWCDAVNARDPEVHAVGELTDSGFSLETGATPPSLR